tara:strand:+ start:550 stop:714 length:165 start_codon:yes stop_codon:yes gene_type:complete
MSDSIDINTTPGVNGIFMTVYGYAGFELIEARNDARIKIGVIEGRAMVMLCDII